MTNALGVHVLHTLQDLVDNPGDLNLRDVLLGGDDVQQLATSGQLGDQSHLVLGVVHLNQTDQTRMMKDIHHLELIHHPVLVRTRPMHNLGSKVTASKSVHNNEGIVKILLLLLDLDF